MGSFTEVGIDRLHDKSDVIRIIQIQKLNMDFIYDIHPYVQRLYVEICNEMKNSEKEKFN